jgi:hypothetical protein
MQVFSSAIPKGQVIIIMTSKVNTTIFRISSIINILVIFSLNLYIERTRPRPEAARRMNIKTLSVMHFVSLRTTMQAKTKTGIINPMLIYIAPFFNKLTIYSTGKEIIKICRCF